MYKLRFRQVHLDFHTSPAIEGIGAAFDAKQWQEALRVGHVNSITCFSKCHHGWSYHDTKVGRRHPHLSFDLLRAQMDAGKEIGVNVPIYLSAGVDNLASVEHPEWREVGPDGKIAGFGGAGPEACFHKMCFNGPYLDYHCEQIREAVRMFPEADGVLLDIIHQGECCCRYCLDWMAAHGLDAREAEHRRQCAAQALEKYYRQTTAAVRCENPDMPVFHNSGHISRGRRDILKYFSHLELESLPTGGWGYDHFPLSAKYCKNLPLDFLGMTGKFHTTWGEFGGYKHPNALRYECSAMLAWGAKCSVGDQLHPEGRMDPSTYEVIGAAYAEVEAKEPWCDDVRPVTDIGLLSSASVSSTIVREGDHADVGAARILLEGHFLFDVLDAEMDFAKHRLLILPDEVRITPKLKAKLDAYLAGGGKLMLTGQSGLLPGDGGFAFDIGADWQGQSPYQPDYVLPRQDLRASFVDMPLVMYLPSQRIRVTSGESLGDVYDPYFNRDYRHFCSHQHAPARPEPSGFACGVRKGNVMYLAHPVFTQYRYTGAVAHQEYAVRVLRWFLGEPTVETNLPTTARVSLMDQPDQGRYVLHLLFANTIYRGGKMELSGVGATARLSGLEVIQDLLPLRDVLVRLRLPKAPRRVTLEPQGREVEVFTKGATVELTVPEFTCHQMIVLKY
jgi:hypothetical protein